MYQVFDKDTIRMEILPHLSVAKRSYSTGSQLAEMVNAILYMLKTGVQGEYLPAKSLFSELVPSCKSVFWHFRKWCKKGDWQESWFRILCNHKSIVNLSSGDMDGSHTPYVVVKKWLVRNARAGKPPMPCILPIVWEYLWLYPIL